MSFLGKEYKLEKDENFDGFLKIAGLPDEEIAKALKLKYTSKLEKNGDEYTLTNVIGDKVKVVKFKSGVELDEEIREGKMGKSTYTVDGNTITQRVKHDGVETNVKREYTGDKLKATITNSAWNGTATRYYTA